MWTFKSKPSQRHYAILQNYFIYQNQQSIKDLPAALNCDIKTVYRTIDDINNIYGVPELFIDPKTQLLSSDTALEYFSFDMFRDFYDNTREFEVLEYLFLFGPISIKKACDDLFISESTMSRLLSHLRLNLRPYRLAITSDLAIGGDERRVRNFFIRYYKEKNGCSLFKNYSQFQNLAFNAFQKLAVLRGHDRFQPYFKEYQWIIFVSLVRLGNNAPLSGDYNGLEYQHSEASIMSDASWERVSQIFDVPREAIMPDILRMFFPKFESKITFQTEIYKDMEQFYGEFIKAFKFSFNEQEEEAFVGMLYNLFTKYGDDSYFLFNADVYHFNILMNHYPRSLTHIHKSVTYLFQSYGIQDENRIYNFIRTILTYTPAIYQHFIAFENRVKVHLFLMTNKELADHVQKLLQEGFENLAIFDSVDTSQPIESYDFTKDTWISDSSLLSGSNVLKVDPSLIYDEVRRVRYFLVERRNQLSTK